MTLPKDVQEKIREEAERGRTPKSRVIFYAGARLGFRLGVEKREITIGPYKIRPFHNGNIWIEGEGGEGMEVSLKTFEEFYNNTM